MRDLLRRNWKDEQETVRGIDSVGGRIHDISACYHNIPDTSDSPRDPTVRAATNVVMSS
jgi:hypothetical protein